MIEDGFSSDIAITFALIESVYSSSDTFCASFEEVYPSQDHFSEFLKDLRARPGSIFLVARQEDRLLGYLFLEPRTQSKLRHTADLNMGVSENARGKGIGSALLKVALQQAALTNIIEIIYLMVRADNLNAIQLYKAVDFEALSTLTRDTRIGADYYDGILMRKFVREVV